MMITELELREGGLEILRERLYAHAPNAPTTLSDKEVLQHFSLAYYDGELCSAMYNKSGIPFHHLHFVEQSDIRYPHQLRVLGDVLEDGSQALYRGPAAGGGVFGVKVIARNHIEEITVLPYQSLIHL